MHHWEQSMKKGRKRKDSADENVEAYRHKTETRKNVVPTGEFINVGVALYASKARFLIAIYTSRYGRLSKMFSNVSGEHFWQISRYIQAKLEEEGERFSTELPFDKLPVSVLEFTTKVLPLDDSSLQFSPVRIWFNLSLLLGDINGNIYDEGK